MEQLQRLQQAVPPLMGWYRIHKRILPWRGTNDAYRVWISEIMLQQTRVEAVKEYYIRFLDRFPNARALAEADQDEVLKYWEGLGYYSRARNLHAASKIIAQNGFPATWGGVRDLPGIGDYTAGAICSIAYDMPCPAVDGNVLRILTRLFADGSNIDEANTKTKFSELLRKVYPREAGDFCQALMELGATVCVPNGAPMCGDCPWESLCKAHSEGEEEDFPVRAPKRARKVQTLTVFVLEHEGKYAIRKRSEKGLLAGMWQFPAYEDMPEPSAYGAVCKEKRAKHIFTHVEWHMTGYLIQTQEFLSDFVWVTAEELRGEYALPSAFKAFMPWVK